MTLSPRYMLIHSDQSTLDMNDLSPLAHAFGPFNDYQAVEAFDKGTPDDTCYRFAVPIVGPENADRNITALGRVGGFRPRALMLPPREPETQVPLQLAQLLREAFAVAEQEGKATRKAEKRARKAEKRAKREMDAIDEANARAAEESRARDDEG